MLFFVKYWFALLLSNSLLVTSFRFPVLLRQLRQLRIFMFGI